MANSHKEPTLIEAGLNVDDRGQVTFANAFSLEHIQRFYMVENFSDSVIRAFHGHFNEEKFVFVVSGSAIVAAVRIDSVPNPSPLNKPYRFVLSCRAPRILHIPAGYANGFRSLEPTTRLLFFSTATLEESKKDDYRFPCDYWGADLWRVEHR
jgi:dTDP-4-dehydrorhamnose 3,5-epimerase-like enzyme